jgi:hypothetical protein
MPTLIEIAIGDIVQTPDGTRVKIGEMRYQGTTYVVVYDKPPRWDEPLRLAAYPLEQVKKI